MTFSRVNWIALRKAEAEIWDTKRRGEARFVERIGLSTERSTNSSLKSAICSCQARRSLRIQGFWDSLDRLARRSRHALVCTHLRYIYNNVTHTPHVRLFLLFRPVARGGFDLPKKAGVVSTARETCQIAAINGTKVKDMERVIIAPSSLPKRFVKPKSCKLYLHFSLFQQCKVYLLYTAMLTWKYSQKNIPKKERYKFFLNNISSSISFLILYLLNISYFTLAIQKCFKMSFAILYIFHRFNNNVPR